MIVARSAVIGRPRTGAPRLRTLRTASLMDGLGAESGPVEVPKPNFGPHFQRPQIMTIKITG